MNWKNISIAKSRNIYIHILMFTNQPFPILSVLEKEWDLTEYVGVSEFGKNNASHVEIIVADYCVTHFKTTVLKITTQYWTPQPSKCSAEWPHQKWVFCQYSETLVIFQVYNLKKLARTIRKLFLASSVKSIFFKIQLFTYIIYVIFSKLIFMSMGCGDLSICGTVLENTN